MELLLVDPRAIQWPENRVTAYYQEGQEELLKESLAGMGQQQPIVVVQVGEALWGVDGLHRCRAAIERGDELVPCVVQDGDDKDVLLRNLVLNSLRGRTKASEQVAVLHELFEDLHMGIEELEERTGHNREWVEKHLAVGEAGQVVRQALDEELITLSHAYELSRVKDLQVQATLCGQQLLYRWSVADLRKHIKETEQAGQERVERHAVALASAPAVSECTFCKHTYEPRLVTAAMVCVSCAGTIIDVRRAQGESS